MRIDVYHHIVVDDGVHQKLDAILTAVSKAVTGVETLQRSVITMSKELDDLRERVAHSIEVEQSAVALIQGLAQQIRDNAQDPIALEELASQLDSSSGSLAAAVTANTPADTTGGAGATGGTTDGGAGADAGATGGDPQPT
jgi:signal transduction protein with GAF and PtsI domain